MKKLIITVGVSGSGKSTWANAMFEQLPDDVRIVNRDKIRELIFGYTEEGVSDYYLRKDLNKLEKEITKYEDTLIDSFLSDNKTVIVDATHLKRAYLERFKYWNVTTQLKVFNVTLDEAIENIKGRGRKVGDAIVKSQFIKFRQLQRDLIKNPISFDVDTIEIDQTKPPCIIFDIDGTLAHMHKRSPYDWKAVRKDKLDYSVGKIAKLINDYIVMHVTSYDGTIDVEEPPAIVICTGRDEVCLGDTKKWLKKHNISFDTILIRPQGDNRPDWQVKQEMWELLADNYNILGMFDDRLQVVRRARALGLKVFNVENNNF